MDPGLSLFDVKTLEDRVSDSVAAPRSAGVLLGIFSLGEPRSGRRPSDEELDVLVAMAEHAAVAVESLQTAYGERRPLVPVRTLEA